MLQAMERDRPLAFDGFFVVGSRCVCS
jgi:hypothetical protein